MTDRELMQMALRALKNAYSFIPMKMMERHLQAETALRDRLAQPEPEPIKWFSAPIKTEWGEDMVMSDLAIDNDHTVSIYCEADQTKKVEAMFKREWVGLTDEEIEECKINGGLPHAINWRISVKVMQAKLKEKNT
jgi:hypothetical protein